MVSDEALKKLQEQIAAWPMTQRFVVQQLIEDYQRNREDLRAYEATRLTPEKVSTLVKDWSDLCTIVGECGGISRVRELAEADKDGRLVVLQEREKWVPVTERLPEVWRNDETAELVNYMIYSPDFGVDIGNYHAKAGKWLCMALPCTVTHWRPLPDGPEVE